MVTLSVILPVRNAEATLGRALRCLRRQRAPGMPLEIVVVDDGSTDASAAVAEREAARDPRIRVLRREPGGLPTALNAGLSAARGAWIARMDADDLCAHDRFAAQLAEAARGCDVVGTRVRMFPARAVTPGMRRFLAWQNALVTHEAMTGHLYVETPLMNASALFRRDALERIGGWRVFDGPEDLDLFLRGREAGWRFGKVPRDLYFWRERETRLTRTDPRYRRDAFRRTALESLLRTLPAESAVTLWGWGESYDYWLRALRTADRGVEGARVNPRAVRGGGPVPPAGPGTLALAYGTEPSRRTMRSAAGDREIILLA